MAARASAGIMLGMWRLCWLGQVDDCVPGRANTTTLLSTAAGSMYGQCSEICGALHGYIPLCIVTAHRLHAIGSTGSHLVVLAATHSAVLRSTRAVLSTTY